MSEPNRQAMGPGNQSPSFLRGMSHRLSATRLGDLLIAGGLITQDQLAAALVTQKQTGEQLGKILVREGTLSAVQLYRKLSEQWCMKATAAGLTMMMHVVSPTSASAAETATATVQLAINTAPAAMAGTMLYKAAAQGGTPITYNRAPVNSLSAIQPAAASGFAAPAAAIAPRMHEAQSGLFGTTEVRSNDIRAFTKWTTVMARFEQQMSTQGSSPRVQMWKKAMQDLRGKSAEEQIAAVNSYVNQVTYIEDKANYGKSDYWATPIEFFARGGDCEDFAIAKYASLRALGFRADQLRIAIVQDKLKHVAHALLIVYTPEGSFVLDNQDKRVRYAQDVNRYKPIFSINSNSWWLHKDTGANV